MSSLLITTATVTEIPLIREIAFDVWPHTYSSIISQEQIDYMLEEMYSPSSLKQQLEQGHRFLLAYESEKPVGFCSFSKENENRIYKLQKLYIKRTSQKKGVATELMRHAIAAIKHDGGKHLILQVNRNNKNAIDFYLKRGFTIQKELDLDIGNGFQMNDYIMEIAV